MHPIKNSSAALKILKNLDFEQYQKYPSRLDEDIDNVTMAVTYLLNHATLKEQEDGVSIIDKKIAQLGQKRALAQEAEMTKSLMIFSQTLHKIVDQKKLPKNPIHEAQDILGPHIPITPTVKNNLSPFLESSEFKTKFLDYCQTVRDCSTQNKLYLNTPYSSPFAIGEKLEKLATLQVELIVLIGAPSNEKETAKIESLKALLGDLLESALLPNSQVNSDTLLSDFKAVEEQDIASRRVGQLVKENKDRNTQLQRTQDQKLREKIQGDMGFISRSASQLLEKTGWKNVIATPDQPIVSGTRVISFRAPDGKQADAEIVLNLVPLGHLDKERCLRVLSAISTICNALQNIPELDKVYASIAVDNQLDLPESKLPNQIVNGLRELDFLNSIKQKELLKLGILFAINVERELTKALFELRR